MSSNDKKNRLWNKVIDKKNQTPDVIRTVNIYKKSKNLIDRVNGAMGKNSDFKIIKSSTTHIKFLISND
jgi:hypothetical protein